MSVKAKLVKKTNIKSTADRLRLSVFRSNSSIYAQIIDDSLGKTIVAASSLKVSGQKTESAKATGKQIAELALKQGIKKVVFDRGAYPYKGRIKALADAARETGLSF